MKHEDFRAAYLATHERGLANIMDQYHPCGDIIPPDSPLSRRITRQEMREAIAIAREEGITRLDRGA